MDSGSDRRDAGDRARARAPAWSSTRGRASAPSATSPPTTRRATGSWRSTPTRRSPRSSRRRSWRSSRHPVRATAWTSSRCRCATAFSAGRSGPSAQYPNYRTRMFRRGRLPSRRAPHGPRGAQADGRGARPARRHDPRARGAWREALGDVWRYTRLEASQFHPAVTRAAAVVGAVARPAAKALYRLVVDGGWRDGWRGLVKVALDAGRTPSCGCACWRAAVVTAGPGRAAPTSARRCRSAGRCASSPWPRPPPGSAVPRRG